MRLPAVLLLLLPLASLANELVVDNATHALLYDTPAAWLNDASSGAELLFKTVTADFRVEVNVRLMLKTTNVQASVLARAGVSSLDAAKDVCTVLQEAYPGEADGEACTATMTAKFDGLRTFPWTNPKAADVGNPGLQQYFMEVLAMERELLMRGQAIGEGHTASCLAKVQVLLDVARQNPITVSSICEIGFNAGHSALAFLSAHPTAHLHSFDLAEYAYGNTSRAYVKAKFPGRVHYYLGDSNKVLMDLLRHKTAPRCDVMFVDGGHTFAGALQDLMLTRLLMNATSPHLVLFDDVSMETARFQPKWSWDTAVAAGMLRELGRVGCPDDPALAFGTWV